MPDEEHRKSGGVTSFTADGAIAIVSSSRIGSNGFLGKLYPFAPSGSAIMPVRRHSCRCSACAVDECSVAVPAAGSSVGQRQPNESWQRRRKPRRQDGAVGDEDYSPADRYRSMRSCTPEGSGPTPRSATLLGVCASHRPASSGQCWHHGEIPAAVGRFAHGRKRHFGSGASSIVVPAARGDASAVWCSEAGVEATAETVVPLSLASAIACCIPSSVRG